MKKLTRVLTVDLDLSRIDMLSGLLCEASPRFALAGCTTGDVDLASLIADRKPALLVVNGMHQSFGECLKLKNNGFEFDLIVFDAKEELICNDIELPVFAIWTSPFNAEQALGDLIRYHQTGMGSKLSRITFSVGQSLKVVKPESIVLVRAEGSYSAVVLENGDEIVLSRNLKSIEEELSDYPFLFRAHKSYIVNLLHVQECCRGGSLRIRLSGNLEAGLSSEKQEIFLKLLQEL